MKREWLAFLSAIQFLTRLPILDPGWEKGRLDRAAKWFPLVGVIVGLIAGAVAACASAVGLSSGICILLALFAAAAVTGALHEDGLADTADGLGGGRDVAHRLSIMKDSSIGVYGAIALIFAFLFRFVLYQQIFVAAPQHPAALISAFVAAHAMSRLSMVGIVWSLTYARDEASAKLAPMSGIAGGFDRSVAGIVSLLALVMIFISVGSAAAATATLLCVAVFFGLRALYLRKLGGWTGDTAGATQVACEIAFLIGLSAWI